MSNDDDAAVIPPCERCGAPTTQMLRESYSLTNDRWHTYCHLHAKSVENMLMTIPKAFVALKLEQTEGGRVWREIPVRL